MRLFETITEQLFFGSDEDDSVVRKLQDYTTIKTVFKAKATRKEDNVFLINVSQMACLVAEIRQSVNIVLANKGPNKSLRKETIKQTREAFSGQTSTCQESEQLQRSLLLDFTLINEH